MCQVGNRPLWIGHAGDLRDPGAVLTGGIEAVIEVADNEQMALLPRDIVRIRIPLSDGGENADHLVLLAANSVAALLSAGVPTLVCCSCGLNRSVCVAAAGIALAEARPFHKVLLAITRNGPADVSPRLLSQFQRALTPE